MPMPGSFVKGFDGDLSDPVSNAFEKGLIRYLVHLCEFDLIVIGKKEILL